jgi:hypothetical protein
MRVLPWYTPANDRQPALLTTWTVLDVPFSYVRRASTVAGGVTSAGLTVSVTRTPPETSSLRPSSAAPGTVMPRPSHPTSSSAAHMPASTFDRIMIPRSEPVSPSFHQRDAPATAFLAGPDRPVLRSQVVSPHL